MKIAIDFDGVVNKHKSFIKDLWLSLVDHNLIGILTAHPPEDKFEDERWLRDNGFPTPDFYIGMPTYEKKIGSWKRRMVREHGIEVLIDDFGGNNPDIEKSFLASGELKFILLRLSPGE